MPAAKVGVAVITLILPSLKYFSIKARWACVSPAWWNAAPPLIQSANFLAVWVDSSFLTIFSDNLF